MSLIERLMDVENIPVTPVGELKQGWQAGVYVYFTKGKLNPKTIACVDKWTSREGALGIKPNTPAGFLFRSNNSIDSKYSAEARQNQTIYGKDGMLESSGLGITTLYITSTGAIKTYIFETKYSNGQDIIYSPADRLYVSDNSIWTKEVYEENGVIGAETGYQVAYIGKDDDGQFLILTNCGF